MTVADIDRAISRLSSPTRELEHIVKSTLSPFCTNFGYPFLSRIKAESSICQKIETGRYRRLIDIDDLVAFTIIIPTGSHEKQCVDFLQSSFNIVDVKTRARSISNPRQFSFDSTRVYARHRCPEWEENTNKTLYRLLFEVQIRTALEHAWVTATHDVVYKSQTIDWQKVRLAAQIKAQVETIDQIFNNFEVFARSVENLNWREGEQTTKVIEFFDRLFVEGVVPAEKMPADRIRLAENAIRLLSKKSISELDNTLNAINDEFAKISQEGFPQSLTLIQTFTLAATRATKQNSPNDRFTPHITKAFSRMFGEVATWGQEFSYDF